MIGDYGQGSVIAGFNAAALISLMYEPNPSDRTTLDEINRYAGPGFTSRQYFPPTRSRPRMLVAQGEQWGLIALGGAESVSQGAALAYGYFPNNPLQTQPNQANSYLTGIINGLAGIEYVGEAGRKPNLLVIGHSLGGAIGTYVAWSRIASQRPGRCVCINFGAPKLGTADINEGLRPVILSRWFCDDDPVPLVLPSLSECPSAIVLYPIQQLANVSLIVQTPGGLQIKSDSSVSTRTYPETASVGPTTALGAWLFDAESNPAKHHSIDEYLARLRTPAQDAREAEAQAPQRGTGAPGSGADPEPLTLDAPIGAFQAEPRVDPGSPLPRPFVRNEINKYFSSAGRGLVLNQPGIDLPSSTIFSKAKYNGRWYTTFGGVPFALGPGRKKSGLLAQAGNLFVRRLLAKQAVDSLALVSQWAEFVIAASDPSSGIRPILPRP